MLFRLQNDANSNTTNRGCSSSVTQVSYYSSCRLPPAHGGPRLRFRGTVVYATENPVRWATVSDAGPEFLVGLSQRNSAPSGPPTGAQVTLSDPLDRGLRSRRKWAETPLRLGVAGGLQALGSAWKLSLAVASQKLT